MTLQAPVPTRGYNHSIAVLLSEVEYLRAENARLRKKVLRSETVYRRDLNISFIQSL